MLLNVLKGKIHRARVVQAELDYVGSITVDTEQPEAKNLKVTEDEGRYYLSFDVSDKTLCFACSPCTECFSRLSDEGITVIKKLGRADT